MRNASRVFLSGISVLLIAPVGLAQPVPGAGAPPPSMSAPVPGSAVGAPPPTAAQAAKNAYQQLPLSAPDAVSRLEELKALLPESNPQTMQDSVFQLCEWLTEMADAHWRLYTAFSKNEATKAQADAEKQTNRKFSQLKHQAQLLKADLLIKQRRYPEALGPLVEIVIADPRSSTGQAAYSRLKEIGFSEEPVITAPPAPPVVEWPPAEKPAATGTAAPTAATTAGKPAATPSKAAPNPTVWLTGTPFGSGAKK